MVRVKPIVCKSEPCMLSFTELLLKYPHNDALFNDYCLSHTESKRRRDDSITSLQATHGAEEAKVTLRLQLTRWEVGAVLQEMKDFQDEHNFTFNFGALQPIQKVSIP